MECNTATFTASDGTQVAFPLDFLIERGAVIADKVNGEDISLVMGCSNQLWIPGFPAKYFIRDIVDITFTNEDEPPALPDFQDDGHDFTNRPNVSCRAKYVGHVGQAMKFEGWADDYDQAHRRGGVFPGWRGNVEAPRHRGNRMRSVGYGGRSSGNPRKPATTPCSFAR